MMRTIKTILMVVVMGLAATAGFAQSPQNSALNEDNITATVIGNCWINTFDLAFGNYDPISETDHDADTSVDVFCTKGVTPNVTLDLGLRSDRTMEHDSSTDVLDYELFSDSAGGTVWPSSGTGVSAGTSTSPVVALTLPIYGRITAEQAVQAGSYFDTVVATVNW
jgi:spore coat protein U-like protein